MDSDALDDLNDFDDEDNGKEDYFDDEDANFLPVLAEREIRKPYDTDFVVYSPAEILQFQQSEIVQVSGILGCCTAIAATLLRHFHWNKERLIESYMDDCDKVAVDAGVIMDASQQPKPTVIEGFECDICCNNDTGLMTLALSCHHRFCVDCYRHYLTLKIAEEGESRRIRCPASGCCIIVDEKVVESVVIPAIYQKYQDLLMRTYVDDNIYLKWCPAPNCEYAVECKVHQDQLKELVPAVTCRCGHTFCFGCSLPNHQPCICYIVKFWIKKCEDDSETANWISANTKECIKCSTTIEKAGGCNHMTCRKCKHEFCWVCMGPWSEHGTSWYSCNRFEEKSGIDARDAQARSRVALERYLHYYNRYANHDQSAKLDRELFEKMEKKMNHMQDSSELSWIEVQFLNKAVEVLQLSRMTLKWTYCFAYYLVRNNATQLFEDNQSDLEMAVEALSELIEQPIDPTTVSKTKQLVLDKMAYVSSRREILLVDTSKGLLEGRWKFTI
ncbi:hypothetical protein BATDEDRAFT_9163 [Batrachochytrium dendrobatidis JAM81]|uniref:RBR-type E3 ubiquitin transferase n=2 Tax=Batrachochytrium dendrobatidis TaxID=109871 RepID=F4NUD2_BATDJ|nr:uncharacterized protein BATDEDRAFT_9163 [Batrachochytrium dendrobatidis JAM81]EGF84003.1 hypothetical protein BATDEDRAFT_9163 [Batrachochytrium dendrobatidis JAM81]|eukprot:XP_006675087.1 hypothetical protein BATDEDRAFT_9163 [Batrachochytrium dendrobatidis JAM81]